MTAIIEITNGTTSVNFIEEGNGFHLQDWTRALSDFKGGGTYQDSPIGEGRQVIHAVRGNAFERFVLKANAISQDSMILDEQALIRLLLAAVAYWLDDNNNTPVYLKVKASKETNIRYTIIHGFRIPELGNQFNPPYLQPDCLSALSDFELIIERGQKPLAGEVA